MKFALNDIVRATNGKLIGKVPELPCFGVGIDTRKIEKGMLFVAIRGAHFDGHDFIGDAAHAGARAVVAEEGRAGGCTVPVVEVKDSVAALGEIAKWWRGQFKLPCVAITGSNGKSTTKEMTSAVASSLGPVLKTEGNFNNLIGLPLTVFRLSDEHRVAILEMGMNAPGEIRRLTEIANPDVGLITNATAAHLEFLHTVNAVAAAKGELFDTMSPGAVAVINGEDHRVMEIGKRRPGKKIIFGMQNGFDVQFLHMEMTNLDSISLKVSVLGREHKLTLPVPGAHNVMNALAALGVGVALGVDSKAAVNALENFRPMAMRFERIQLVNGVRVVNDSYNANPESMKAAFRTVGAAKRAGRFIAALGDMLELGEASNELHREVGEAAARMGAEMLYLLGDHVADFAEGAKRGGLDESAIVICEGGTDQMARLLEREIHPGDVILVKGSRGMRMERVVEYLKNEIGMG